MGSPWHRKPDPLCKKPQSGKIREVSGKRNGKRKRPRNRFFQITAIREDPGSFREEKREGRNRLSKTRSPGRSGKFPGRQTERRNSQETISFQNSAIREDPGSFREEKREERNRPSQKPAVREVPGRFRDGFREGVEALEVLFLYRFLLFPRHHIPPIRSMCLWEARRWHTGSYK